MIQNSNLVKFSSLLFYLIPLALLTGPFIPDLFISIISVIFLYYCYTKKLIKYFTNKFFILFIIFYAYLIINSLLSEYTLFSLESSIFYFRFGIFSLATWFLVEHNDKFFSHFKIIFLFTFLFAILDGYIQYIYGVSLFGFGIKEIPRLSLSFNDKLILGGYLARLFTILIALLLLGKNNILKYLFFAIILIATDILIYVSGERTAMGLMFLSTILIIFFLNSYRSLRIITLLLSIFLIIWITLSSEIIKDRNINQTIDQLGFTSESGKINIYSPIHESHIISAYKMFKDSPLIGKGVNTFRKYCNDPKYNINTHSCSTHPHNSSIQILAETGIIGFLPILGINIYIILLLIRNFYLEISGGRRILTNYQILLIISILLSVWPLFPTQNIFNNWINIIYYFPVGLYLHSIYSNNSYVES